MKMKKKSKGPKRLGASLDDAYDIASRAYSTAMRLATYFNVEQKLFDNSGAGVAVGNTSGSVFLTDITQGVAYNQRTGNSVKAIKHLMSFRVRVNNSASATTVRLIVVRGRETETSVPTTADVLETGSANLALISPYEHTRPDRFTILFDRTFAVVVGGENATTVIETQLKVSHLLYQNGTGGIANAAEGQIFLLYISDEATNTPSLDWYSRVVFVDN